VTAAAPHRAVVILGRSLLEGIGAALIMPVVVARVAGNVASADRSRADGHSADTDQDPTDRRISPDHGAELDFRWWHTAHTTRPGVRSMS
jgi:hypothetical protein